MEVSSEFLPKDVKSEFPSYVTSFQTLVAFANTGKKKESPTPKPDNVDLGSLKRIDITNFVVDQPFEPWNEFVLQGNPAIMIRTRTIMSKLEWFPEYTDIFGSPALSASHNTTHSVGTAPVGEGGMT